MSSTESIIGEVAQPDASNAMAERRFEGLVPRARLLGPRSDLAFRTLLDTTSRPGRIGRFVDPQFVGVPSVLFPVLALANVDTRVAVVAEDHASTAEDWSALVCRATDAQPSAVAVADIVTVMSLLDPDLVAALRVGTPERPELGARLILTCEALFEANEAMPICTSSPGAVTLELTGPGIDGRCRLVVVGVPVAGFERLAAVNTQPSCGLDVHLVESSGRIVSLPRSTRISVVLRDTSESAISN